MTISHCGSNPYENCGSGRSVERFGRGFGGGRFRSGGAGETDVKLATQKLASLETDGRSARRTLAETASASVEKSGFDSRRDFVHTAKKMVRGAVASLAQDVGKAFESMGLNGDAAKDLVKGFVKPLVQALRSGADFTAQLRFAAVQKTTVVTAEGVSESLSVLAKSVDISVNHDTGEISVDVKSLSIEQDSVTAFQAPAGQPPAAQASPRPFELPAAGAPAGAPAGLGGDGPALPDLSEIIERALQAARERSGLGSEGGSEAGGAPETDGPVTFNPGIEVLLPNAEAGDAGGEDAATRLEALRSRLRIDSAQRFRNEAGELITRLRVDARISLTRVLETQPEALSELAAASYRSASAFDIRA